MRVLLMLCLLAAAACAQTVTTVTAPATSATVTTVTSGAQALPNDADVAQVLRALAILRGRPAIVPLTDANNVPLPAAPLVVVPQPVPVPDVVSDPAGIRPADPVRNGVRIRSDFPFGSLLTPKNVRGF